MAGDENGGAANQTTAEIGEVLKTVLTLQAVGAGQPLGAARPDLDLKEREPVTVPPVRRRD